MYTMEGWYRAHRSWWKPQPKPKPKRVRPRDTRKRVRVRSEAKREYDRARRRRKRDERMCLECGTRKPSAPKNQHCDLCREHLRWARWLNTLTFIRCPVCKAIVRKRTNSQTCARRECVRHMANAYERNWMRSTGRARRPRATCKGCDAPLFGPHQIKDGYAVKMIQCQGCRRRSAMNGFALWATTKDSARARIRRYHGRKEAREQGIPLDHPLVKRIEVQYMLNGAIADRRKGKTT